MRVKTTHQIQPAYEPLLRTFGSGGDWVFSSDLVRVWRKLVDRENCTLDANWPDGRKIRLHVKRYPPRWAVFAEREANAFLDLERSGIPCASVAAWGCLADGRAYLITEDLAGFEPADKYISRGGKFETVLASTAELAANLHNAGFHHRDLYLCHFMVRAVNELAQVKLIDAARVGRLPGWPLRKRWIIKDLAQFWYSATQLPIVAAQRAAWLEHYASKRGIADAAALRRSIESKSRRIAAHDVNLNRRQPTRHLSIPN
jgi:hypothetical protein